jgi:hypothetical protein
VGRFFSVALILCIAGLGAGVARAQSELVVKIDDRASGPAIPDDFAGLSFESSNLLADKNGSYRFSGSKQGSDPVVSNDWDVKWTELDLPEWTDNS